MILRQCLRQQVADWLNTNQNNFWEGIPIKTFLCPSVGKYISGLQKGMWGGEIEIRALSDILRTKINVFTDQGDRWGLYLSYGEVWKNSSSPINLLRTGEGGGHYVRLVFFCMKKVKMWAPHRSHCLKNIVGLDHSVNSHFAHLCI